MATTEHFYTGNGSTTTYAYTFPYYKTSDIKVTWDDVAKTESTHYNVTGTNIVFTSGNIPGNGVAIHIYRDTDVDTSKATFAAGSSIRATDLNNNETQLLYSAQENQSRLIRTAEIKDNAITSAKIKDGTIATADIADDAITAAKIAADAVGASEIGANAVGASELANNAVDTAAIVDDAVTGAKIGSGQVGPDNLADNAVTTAKLNNTSVTADKIASNAVITAKLDTGAVTAAKIGTDAVTTVKILDNNVTTAKIGNNQVTEDKMADNSVNSDQYVDGSIDTAHIGDSQVTTAKLENNAVTNAKMADDAIGTAEIQDNAVTNAQLADDAVNTAEIADNAITNALMADNAIGAAEIQNGVVGTVKITDNAVTMAKLAGGVLPTDITVASANLVDGTVATADIADSAVTTAKINDDAITTAKIAASAVTHAEILNGTIGADKLDVDSVTTAKIADSNVTTAKIADTAIGTAKLANDAVTADKIADAVIVTASEQAAASANDTTFFTTSASDARYFNVSTGDTIKDGDTFPDNDTTIATTAAINDRIIDLVDDVGGFVPIANETSFPNANPDVNNGTGTLVSIKALSSNLTSNGSGVATIANGTVGNSTVTITGLANSTTYLATYGMIVETTSTLNTYTFHRQVPIATEISTVAGSISNVNTVATNISNVNTVASNNSNVTTTAGSISNVNLVGGSITNVNSVASNLSTVNDFAARYRTGSSNPTSSLDTGDLFFNTTANELKVYNGSEWQGGVTATGNFAVTTGNTFTGDNLYNDSVKLKLGTGSDLQLFHSGVNSVIDNNTGGLYIRNNVAADVGGDIFIQAKSGENSATFTHDGDTSLYYDNSQKFHTRSDGVRILGDATWSDDGKARFGPDGDLQIYHDGNKSNIVNTTGELVIRDDSRLRIRTDELVINSGDNTESIIYAAKDGAVELYHNNVKKLETISGGVLTHGNSYVNDSDKFIAGTGNDLQIYHDGNNSKIINSTGNLTINAATSEVGVDIKPNGAVELYYDNSKKFETTSEGTYFSGRASVDGNILIPNDSDKLKLGSSQDLQIYHDGTHNYLYADNGELKNRAAIWKVVNEANSEIQIKATENAAVELYYDHSKKLETTSTGVTLADGLILDNATTAGRDIQWQPSNDRLAFFDNTKATFGDGVDLQIYHASDASVNKIESGTNTLYIGADHVQLTNGAITEAYVKGVANGAVELYYDNVKKAETMSGGLSVTGQVAVAGSGVSLSIADSGKAAFGTGDDLQIYHDGTDARFHNTTGRIITRTETNAGFYNSAGSESLAIFTVNGSCDLYYDNSKKLETKSWGVEIPTDQALIAQGSSAYIKVQDSGKFYAGNDEDLQIYHDGSHSNIINKTGNLYINASASDTALKIVPDGAVELYNNNVLAFQTHANGARVIGAEGASATFYMLADEGDDNGDYWRLLADSGSCNFKLQNQNSGSWETNLRAVGDTGVQLYYDNSQKLTTSSTGIEVTGNVHVNDSDKLQCGNSADLKIYHDGSASYIQDSGTGQLRIDSNAFEVMNAADSEYIIKTAENGGVELYYDNNLKLSTVSDGVRIDNGHLRLDRDDAYIKIGAGNDLQIWHDGSNSHISDRSGTGALRISSDNLVEIKENDANNWSAKFNIGGAAELYHNSQKVFETLSYGARIKRPSGGSTDFEVFGCEGQNAYIHMYADEGDDNADKWRLASETGNNAFWIQNYAEGDWAGNIECRGEGAVYISYDNNTKLQTRSDGVRVDDNLLVNTDNDDANINDSSGESQFSMRGNGQGLRLSTSGPSYWNAFSSAEYHIRFRRQGSNTGNIYGESNGTTTFNTGSDYRLKQNVTAYTDGITKLKKLKPCEFEFKLEPGKVVDGFIAHEVTDAGFPWIVKGTKDAVESDGKIDPQSMDYSKLTPILTAALQEAITKIETLEAKVAALESS